MSDHNESFEEKLFEDVINPELQEEDSYITEVKIRLHFIKYLLQNWYNHMDLSHVKLLWELLV